MALIQATEIKQTDPYIFVPAALTGTAAAISATACGVRVFIAPFNMYLLQMTAYMGSGTFVATTTLQAATGTSTGGVAVLGTTLGAVAIPAASTAVALNIDTTAADAPLGPVIAAGTAIGFNIPTVGSQTMTITGVGIRYRMA